MGEGRCRSASVLTYMIYTFLMSIFYFTAGGISLNADVGQVSNSTSIVFEISVFLFVSGGLMCISAVTCLLLFFVSDVVSDNFQTISLIIFDLVNGALYLSVAIPIAAYTRTLYIFFSLYQVWPVEVKNTFATGIALAVLSLFGFFFTLVISYVRIKPMIVEEFALPQASINDIR